MTKPIIKAGRTGFEKITKVCKEVGNGKVVCMEVTQMEIMKPTGGKDGILDNVLVPQNKIPALLGAGWTIQPDIIGRL